MRIVVAGLGIQGRKRIKVAGESVVATVDPAVKGATYRAIEDIPPGDFDAAFLCLPDSEKPAALRYLIDLGKHVMVEKPLVPPGSLDLEQIEHEARRRGAIIYTAYNHRFEPHLAQLANLIRDGAVGEPYRISMFYGNGTAREVRASAWRDEGLGVIADLLPHLLDTLLLLRGRPRGKIQVWSATMHENRAFDHFAVGFPTSSPAVALEGTLLSWRNTFRLDVLAEEGSAHVTGLCKWGPSTLAVRRRVLPSGRPPEEAWTLERADPTWALEHEHFVSLCRKGTNSDLSRDVWIDSVLRDVELALPDIG